MARTITREESESFNKWRAQNAGKTMKTANIIDALKAIFITGVNNTLLMFLSEGDDPPFKNVSRGLYRVKDTPVYLGKIQRCWEKASKYHAKSNKKWKTKTAVKTVGITKEAEPTPKPLAVPHPSNTANSLEKRIQDSIKLLKENGYQVRKIKIEYEEV